MTITQDEIIRLALLGCESVAAELRSRLEKSAPPAAAPVEQSTTTSAPAAKKAAAKGSMSEQGRANIREALRKRWAAYYASQKAAPNQKATAKKSAPVKKGAAKKGSTPTMTPARKQALIANLQKAREAKARKAA